MTPEISPSSSPGPAPRIRVLIVEDHVVTRLGLRTCLEALDQLEVVGEAGSLSAALSEAIRLRPDVMLLDIRLPDGNGFVVCRQLQKLNLETRILILTSYADDDMIFESIAAGADGYLLKEIDGDGLLRAIQNVAEGKSILDPAITRRVLSRVRLPMADVDFKNKLSLLSAQERRVLALVAEGKTNKEVAADMGLSDKTVKNYLSNTLEKLKVNRRSQAVALFTRGSQS